MRKEQEWFHQSGWGAIPDISAHASINLTTFYTQFHAYPELWRAVFEFLKKDLKALEAGKYPIMGDQVFAMVSEYSTKKPEETKWEAHKKYIDLQYVIEGEEEIGMLPLEKAILPQPYDGTKDLLFFQDQPGEYFVASPDFFFLFFPEDVHRPGIMLENPGTVKKLVIKIAALV